MAAQKPPQKRQKGPRVKLGIADRVQLLNILPAEGNIVTLRIVNDLRTDLSFSEKEIAEGGIEVEDGQIRWKPDAPVVKDVKIGDTAKDLIKDALKKLDDEKKLTAGLVPIWDKFMS